MVVQYPPVGYPLYTVLKYPESEDKVRAQVLHPYKTIRSIIFP